MENAQFVKIRIGSELDARGFDGANRKFRELTASADEFLNAIKLGVGIDLGGKLVNSLAALPGIFQGAIQRGVEFNATMEGSEMGIANIVAKFQGLDAAASKGVAADAMRQIQEIEPKVAGGLQDLVQGFMATFASSQSAGVSIAQNVELVGLFANALASASIPAEQLSQEMRSIFTGNITADSSLAKILQINNADIAKAKEAGSLYQFLVEKIGSLGAATESYKTIQSTLNSTIEKTLGALSKPVFETLKQAIVQLNEQLGKPDAVDGLKSIGFQVAHIVGDGAALIAWAVKNAETLGLVARGAAAVGVALAALKLTTIIEGLGLKAAAWIASAKAIDTETAALGRNTAAKAANSGAGAGVGAGRALGTLNAGVLVATVGVMAIQSAEAAAEARAARENQVGDELKKQVELLQTQITQADTIEKKSAAEQDLLAARQKLIAEGAHGSELEKEARASSLIILNRLLENFDQIAGTRAATVATEKKLTDEQIKQQAAAAQQAAITNAEGALIAARASGDQERIARRERELALAEEIARLQKDNANLTAEQAQKQAELNLQLQRQVAAQEQNAQLKTEIRDGTEVPQQREARLQSEIAANRAKLNQTLPPSLAATMQDGGSMQFAGDLAAGITDPEQQAKALAIIKQIVDAENELVKLQTEQQDRARQTNEEREKQAAADQADRDRAAAAQADFELETRILSLKRDGNTAEAERLTQQREATRLAQEFQISQEEALKLVQERAAAEKAVTAEKQTQASLDPRPGRSGNRGGRAFDINGRDVTAQGFDSAGNLSRNYQSTDFNNVGSQSFTDAFRNNRMRDQLAGAAPSSPKQDAGSGTGTDAAGATKKAGTEITSALTKLTAEVNALSKQVTEKVGGATAAIGTARTAITTAIAQLQTEIDNLKGEV